MPTGRCDYGIASINGKIYVAGGVRMNACGKFVGGTNALECYDPILSTWINKETMSGSRNLFVLFEWSKKLYAIGYANNVDQYDPDDDKWTTVRINA